MCLVSKGRLHVGCKEFFFFGVGNNNPDGDADVFFRGMRFSSSNL